jgi:hypothetical protein
VLRIVISYVIYSIIIDFGVQQLLLLGVLRSKIEVPWPRLSAGVMT